MNQTERLARDGVEDPVLFYQPTDEFGVFSNFSWHAIELPSPWTKQLTRYQTSEHRYQAMKADNQEQHDDVVAQNGPGAAKTLGQIVNLRPGWGSRYGDLCWWVMVDALYAKAHQVDDFLDTLVQTNGRHIYEDSPIDDIWGWRYRQSYSGQNLLGIAIMHVRAVVIG